MVAVTGAAGVGALSILLLKKNATNVFPNTRMGILGASILGVAIPLWIVRKWVAGNSMIFIITQSNKRSFIILYCEITRETSI
jgi:hypothetical protein